ncbi:hypothetical protein Pmani_022748 [Petrolisthes manimaculis]|uniref:Uncharacterized protein n=1 Tax=Petrolisthes manimaculis TaxID=1843537 RepID=A0AAE1PBE3_9EUCA|nr:hypothetical protein Pmani_022748 [Petrolisthes manimaculis]
MIRLNVDAGKPLSEQFLRMRHTKLMPHTVQLLLLSHPQLSLQEYGELADTLMEAQFDHVDNPLTTQNNIYHTDTTTGSPPPQASPAPPTTDTALLLQRLQDLSEQVRQLQHSAHPTRQPHQTQDRHLPPPFTPTRQQWASPTSVNQGRAQVPPGALCY